MNTAYLLLGGNLGDRAENLRRASEMIRTHAGTIAKRSDMYVTAAWGKEDQADFYNMALCVKTEQTAAGLLKKLLWIEEQLGRKREGEKWQERLIDIDILFYNEEVIDEMDLKVPHPHLQERRFVLAPLCEIASDLIHPIIKKTVKELLENCKDPLTVKPLEQLNTRTF